MPNQVNWTDGETEMLLSVVLDYKNDKSTERIDWTTCKSRYDQIYDSFIQAYDGKKDNDENFPHKQDLSLFKKTVIINKVKRIKANYSKAVLSGKKSGNGRVVYKFRGICDEIWGGSPSVEAVSFGLETERDDAQVEDLDQLESDVEETTAASTTSSNDAENTSTNVAESDIATSSTSREVINGKINRSARLNRKISTDDMYLKAINAEQKFKRRCEGLWQQTNDELRRGTEELTKMRETMSQGFSLLTSLIQQQQAPQYQGFSYYPLLQHTNSRRRMTRRTLFRSTN